jgi:hypothetical protein
LRTKFLGITGDLVSSADTYLTESFSRYQELIPRRKSLTGIHGHDKDNTTNNKGNNNSMNNTKNNNNNNNNLNNKNDNTTKIYNN